MQDLAEFGDQEDRRIADALGAYVQAPDPEVRSAHMAAITAEAATLRHAADSARHSADRLNRHPTRRFRMTPRRLAVLPAALVLALLGMAGLAAAGVNLPSAARAPFDAVGVNLPNQSRAAAVHAVIDATQPGDRGCEFGQAVAAAASQGRSQGGGNACSSQGSDHSQAADHGQSGDHGQGAEHGQASAGSDQAQGGQPSGVPPTPPAGQEFGQSTADRKSVV